MEESVGVERSSWRSSGFVRNDHPPLAEAVSWSKGAAPGFVVKRVEEGLIDVKNHFFELGNCGLRLDAVGPTLH